MVTQFYQSIFTRDPEQLVPIILAETARVFEADIATWFLVTEDRKQLVLVDVYNDRGERTKRPDIKPYNLNWDLNCQKDKQGLTAWVAISGQPLFIDSLASLHQNKAHRGHWDNWLYPDGVNDPTSGFLCLYAVPLSLPINKGSTKDGIVGVVKMERRKHRQRAFSESERKAFDVIAKVMGFAYIHSERQKALTLIDIGHTLIRPLGDVAVSLELIALSLEKDGKFGKTVQKLEDSASKLRGLSYTLNIIKDSFNNPTDLTRIDLKDFLGNQAKIFSLQTDHKIINISDREKKIIFHLTKRAAAALMNLWINLIDNAIRYSYSQTKIEYYYVKDNEKITIAIRNKGMKIPDNVISKAKDLQIEPDLFKGLPRAYQLAVRYGWTMVYERDLEQNLFIITIPYTSPEVIQYAK